MLINGAPAPTGSSWASTPALPLVTTSVGNPCIVRSTNTSGKLVAAGGVTAQILGWAFATLLVAGFTGAVRKT
jgi:hypothetical protein